jgi:hypothetical protein
VPLKVYEIFYIKAKNRLKEAAVECPIKTTHGIQEIKQAVLSNFRFGEI